MPIASQGLSQELRDKLNSFIKSVDMRAHYMSYGWRNDTHTEGFPDIARLELQLRRSEVSTGITLDDAKDVAEWGAMRNRQRISGKPEVLPPNTLVSSKGRVQSCLRSEPQAPLDMLKLIKGFGPTYQSKVLRFALPEEYGAIDTRIVRVFGQGDPKAAKHAWLKLKTTRGTHRGRATGWSISANQKNWPSDFACWINILRYIAHKLDKAEVKCPHPELLEKHRLRKGGAWTCADVEMALFCYASKFT